MNFTILFALIPLGLLLAAGYGLFVAIQFVRIKFGWIQSKEQQLAETTQQKNPFVLPAFFGFTALLLIVGYNIGLYDALIPQRVPTVGLAIFQFCIGIGWLFLFSKRKMSAAVLLLVGSSVLSGIFLIFRANGFVQSFNGVVWLLSTFGLFALFVRQHTNWSFLSLIQTLLQMIPAGFLQVLLMIGSVFRSRRNKRSTLFGWLKTAGIAIAVLLFFIGILSQSDPVFNELVKDFREQLFGRTIQSIFLLLIAGATVSIVLPKQSEEPWRLRFFSYRDVLAILVTTLLIIGLFLSVQFRYLFGGSRELLVALDLTFSEYVRKGFIELLIATFAGGVLVYLMVLKQRVAEKGRSLVLKIASSALVIELFLLLGSALKRDLLYVETYGLTRVRVVGGLFLVWLAGLLLLLLFFVLWKRVRELDFTRVIWGLSLTVWLALNLLNVDAIVANGSPEHHEYTDYFYLANLSEDVAYMWPGMLENIANDTNYLIAKDALTDTEQAELAGLKLSLVAVMERRERLYMHHADPAMVLEKYEELGVDSSYRNASRANQGATAVWTKLPKQLQAARSWRFYNAAEQQAADIVLENKSLFFETVDRLYEEIQIFQITHNIDLEEHEDRLLRELQYPFISISLNYYPQSLSTSIGYLSQSRKDQQKKLFVRLEESRDYTVESLQEMTCGSAQTLLNSLEVYSSATIDSDGGIWLRSLSNENTTIRVQAARPPLGPENPSLATLRPSVINSSEGCSVVFTLEKFIAIKTLSNGRN